MTAAPRWLNALTKAASLPENKGQNIYQLTTVDANNRAHGRTVVHRDIIQPSDFPNLPVILTTTDVRTPKVAQMRSNTYAEIVWWMAGSQDQFRLTGPVRIVSSPTDNTLPSVGEETLALDKLRDQGYDLEQKRQAVFDNMSAHMKASWCRPPPGTAMDSYEDAKKWPTTVPKLGEAKTDEEKRNQAQALSNFGLILLEPVEVDWLQLAEKPNQRTKYTRHGEDWAEQIIVP